MRGSKRQETKSSSSSSLRSTSGRGDLISPVPTTGRKCQNQYQHQVKVVNVGCMSGIFHLVSKYHTPRKFLTFGKKAEKQVPTPANPNTTTITLTCQSRDNDTGGRSSLEIPRSPRIPPEIRNLPRTTNSPRTGTCNSPRSEKRRKLVGALEKCDEDLKELKRIIEAARVAQTPPRKKRDEGVDEEEKREVGSSNNSTPSPVSVLHFSRSPPFTTTFSKTPLQYYGQELKQKHIQKQEAGKMKPEKDEHFSDLCFLNKPSFKQPNSVINIASLTSSLFRLPHSETWSPLSNVARRTRCSPLTILPWSKAVVESVDEVCRDVEWEFRLEFGRIGLKIQDFIFEELLEEFTKDMMLMLMKKKRSCDYVFSSSRVFALPYEACKRKLCF